LFDMIWLGPEFLPAATMPIASLRFGAQRHEFSAVVV